jgi:hypothetical protein
MSEAESAIEQKRVTYEGSWAEHWPQRHVQPLGDHGHILARLQHILDLSADPTHEQRCCYAVPRHVSNDEVAPLLTAETNAGKIPPNLQGGKILDLNGQPIIRERSGNHSPLDVSGLEGCHAHRATNQIDVVS